MSSLRSNALGLAVLIAVWGCGSSGGGAGSAGSGGAGSGGGGNGGSATSSIALPEFPSEYMNAYCSYMARCGFMPDKATCEDTLVLNLPQLVAGVNAEKIKYDPKAAAACTANIESLPCTDDGQALRCEDALRPLVINGGACFLNEECLSRNCDTGLCHSETKCCPGTCRPAEDCLDTGCPDGQYCRRNAGPATCEAKAGLGQPCFVTESDESPCVAGATCMGELGGETCQTIPTEGQTCELKTSFMKCDIGLYCDPDTLKCTRRIPVGGACEDRNCASNAHCDSNGKCLAELGLGEECGDEDWCLGDLLCISGTCSFLPAPPICE